MLNFKQLRKKKNLTQSEFSELLGISTRALSNYENGNTDISLKKMQEIAETLKIDFFELFEHNNEIINKVEEPVATYLATKNESYDLLVQNYNLLKEQNALQEELINMLKEKVADCQHEKKLLATLKKMD